MAKKRKEQAQVLAQKQLAPGIYDCLLKTTLAEEAKPGQFIALYPKDKSTLLPRPISICEADAERNTLRIVYRVVGAGTEEFSRLKEGDTADILGVLGNGFPLDQVRLNKIAQPEPPQPEVTDEPEVDPEAEAAEQARALLAAIEKRFAEA